MIAKETMKTGLAWEGLVMCTKEKLSNLHANCMEGIIFSTFNGLDSHMRAVSGRRYKVTYDFLSNLKINILNSGYSQLSEMLQGRTHVVTRLKGKKWL